MKEKGYIPTTKDGWKIKSGTVSVKADRYYVSVLVEIPDVKIANNSFNVLTANTIALITAKIFFIVTTSSLSFLS